MRAHSGYDSEWRKPVESANECGGDGSFAVLAGTQKITVCVLVNEREEE